VDDFILDACVTAHVDVRVDGNMHLEQFGADASTSHLDIANEASLMC
jgi:hypothetical protein